MSPADIVLLPLRTFHDVRGDLTTLEPDDGVVPFAIRRVYYIHHVPTGVTRGGHAHRALRQLMICLSGRLDVHLDDGRGRVSVTLSDPRVGLLLAPMTWREMNDFAPDTVCLVLASEPYDEADYIHDYPEFVREASRIE